MTARAPIDEVVRRLVRGASARLVDDDAWDPQLRLADVGVSSVGILEIVVGLEDATGAAAFELEDSLEAPRTYGEMLELGRRLRAHAERTTMAEPAESGLGGDRL